VTQQVQQVTATSTATTLFNYGGLGLNPSAGNGTVVVTDPNGNQTMDIFSGVALIGKVTGYGSNTPASWTYQRDPATLMSNQTIDPNGNIVQYADDSYGRVTAFQDAVGNQLNTSYNAFTLSGGAINPAALLPAQVVNASGTASVNNTYNNDGTLSVKVVHPDYPTNSSGAARTTNNFYASNGERTGVQDPLGRGQLYS
jgi:hypothetical protein